MLDAFSSSEISLNYISGEIIRSATEIFKDRVEKQAEISFDIETKKAIGQENIDILRDFMQDLNLKTLIFLSCEAKRAFIADVKALLQANVSILEAINYSRKHNKMWICHKDSTEDKGIKYGIALYTELLRELDNMPCETEKQDNTQEQNEQAQKEGVIPHNERENTSENHILHIQAKYGNKIQEFFDYRCAKGRFFNKHSLRAFYNTLCEFESKNKDISAIIDQSINRDYNWIFPITHKKIRKSIKHDRKRQRIDNVGY